MRFSFSFTPSLRRFTLSAMTFLLALPGQPALGDALEAGWSFSMTCPTYDQAGLSGNLSLTSANGFTCGSSCGACQRLSANRFQSLSFSGPTVPSGVNLASNPIYAVNVGKFLFTPPILSSDTNPIFGVSSTCNNYTSNVNWLFIQIDPANFSTIKTGYLLGKSTLSPASTTLTNNFDINGTQTWSGSYSLPISACSGGVYSISGSVDFDAKMYTGDDWSGVYKTGPGEASLFLPQVALTQSTLGSLTYHGIFFNSGTASSVTNVQVTSDAAGDTFTVTPYVDVTNNTLSGTIYDTIKISSVNTPFNGAMKGTVSRNGTGLGRVVCLANQGGGDDGQLVACTGEDPADNSKPYSVIFDYKPAAGTVLSVTSTALGTGTDIARSVAIDAYGRIILGGTSVSGAQNLLAFARYQSDGTLDTSFGSQGTVITALASLDGSPSFTARLQSDGKIVGIGYGTTTPWENVLTRYNSDGTIDSTFGTGGVVHDAFNTSSLSAYDGALDTNGNIVTAGYFSAGPDYMLAVRYGTAGAVDTSFATSGRFKASGKYAMGMAIQSDGKFVLVGGNDSSSTTYLTATRLNTNGSLDSSFGTSGTVKTQVGTSSSNASSAVIQSDQKIVMGGCANNGSGYVVAMARYTSAGQLDTTFGSSGEVFTPIVCNDFYADGGLALQADGRILIAGNTPVQLARYWSDGTLDTAFGTAGVVATPVNSNNKVNRSIALQGDGTIVVSGYTIVGGKDDFAVARISP